MLNNSSYETKNVLSIMKSVKRYSNFLTKASAVLIPKIIDRLPKDFKLIAGDSVLEINSKIVYDLCPTIREMIDQDKNCNSYTFKKESAFPAIPYFFRLLKGEQVFLDSKLTLPCKKLSKELKTPISINNRIFSHLNSIAKRGILSNLQPSPPSPHIISYSPQFFKITYKREFIIKTRSSEYKCNYPLILSSNLLYRLLQENENQTSYFYDVEDKNKEYEKIFDFFKDGLQLEAIYDYDLLYKFAVDFEIDDLPELIKDLQKRADFVNKRFNEYDFSESEKLMNILGSLTESEVDSTVEYLRNSIWMSDNEHIKELASNIVYIASYRIHQIPPICSVVKILGQPLIKFLEILLYHCKKNYFHFKSGSRYSSSQAVSLTSNFIKELSNRQIIRPKNQNNDEFQIPIFTYQEIEKHRIRFHRYGHKSRFNYSQSVNFTYMNSSDPLKIFIYNDDVEQLRANFNIESFTPYSTKNDINYIQFATLCGSVKCFKFLMDLNIYSFSPDDLSLSIQGGCPEITEILFSHPDTHSDPPNTSFRKRIAQLQSSNIISAHYSQNYDLKTMYKNDYSLIDAAKHNNFKVIKECKNLLFDFQNGDLLEDIIDRGFIDMFFFIMHIQPDVDSALISLNEKRYDEKYHLILHAAAAGSVRLLKFLLEHFKNFSSFDVLFEIAVDNYDFDVIKFLICECNYKPPCDIVAYCISRTFTPGRIDFVELFYKANLISDKWLMQILEVVSSGNNLELVKDIVQRFSKIVSTNTTSAEINGNIETDNRDENDRIITNTTQLTRSPSYNFAFLIACAYGAHENAKYLSSFIDKNSLKLCDLAATAKTVVKSGDCETLKILMSLLPDDHDDAYRNDVLKEAIIKAIKEEKENCVKYLIQLDHSFIDNIVLAYLAVYNMEHLIGDLRVDLYNFDIDDLEIGIHMLIEKSKNPNLDFIKRVNECGRLPLDKYLPDCITYQNYDCFLQILNTPSKFRISASKMNSAFFKYANTPIRSEVKKLIQIKSSDPFGFLNPTPQTSFIEDKYHPQVFRPLPVKEIEFHENEEILNAFLNFEDIDVNYNRDIEPKPIIIAAAITNKINLLKALVNHPDIDLNATDEEGLTALMHAARLGNREVFDILFNAPGIDINKRTYLNRTTLSFATLALPEVVPIIIKSQQFDIIKSHVEVAAIGAFSKFNFELFDELLKLDFDVNQRIFVRPIATQTHDNFYMKDSIYFRELNLPEDNKQKHVVIERNMLEIMALNGQSFNLHFIKRLIQHPRFDNSRSNINVAILKAAKNPYQNAEILQYLLNLGNYNVNYDACKTPLLVYAANNDNTNVINMIINSPDFDRESPQVLAAFCTAIFKENEHSAHLLEKLVDINSHAPQGIRYPTSINLSGMTPLTLSLISGSNICFRLLEKTPGIDMNAPNLDGTLPVFYALKNSSTMPEIAYSKSFDVNVVDSKGETPIMKMLKSDDSTSLWIYLKRDDIDLLKLDNRGNSVRSILEKKGIDTSELSENPTNKEMLEFMRKIYERHDFTF